MPVNLSHSFTKSKLAQYGGEFLLSLSWTSCWRTISCILIFAGQWKYSGKWDMFHPFLISMECSMRLSRDNTWVNSDLNIDSELSRSRFSGLWRFAQVSNLRWEFLKRIEVLRTSRLSVTIIAWNLLSRSSDLAAVASEANHSYLYLFGAMQALQRSNLYFLFHLHSYVLVLAVDFYLNSPHVKQLRGICSS